MKTKIKKIYQLSPQEVLDEFSTKISGLSDNEAQKRLKEHGLNIIKKKNDWGWLWLILNQFNSPFAFILLIAAILGYILGAYRDSSVIVFIVLINACIGFFQEFKADRILKKIQKLTTDKAVVVRGGVKSEIDSKLLVPGDVVFLSAGDNAPTDGYLLESYDLYISDFIFTGESKPNKKEVGALKKEELSIGERNNMVFMGSTVARGESTFVVTSTGMDTELGRIAYLTKEIKPEDTPLQKRMKTLGKEVAIISVIVGLAVVVIGGFMGVSWFQTFLFALALSVSVVPEGLPAALSVALSLGMKKLLKKNVLAKKLSAVETLGSVSVICTDKTGTITRNELTVTKIFLNNKFIDVAGEGYTPKGNFMIDGKKVMPQRVSGLDLLFKIGVLCNDADLTKKDGEYGIIGDPTEGAIIVASRKYNFKNNYFYIKEKKINEIPFSSDRMRMSVVYKNKKPTSFVKGSPDILIQLCDSININGKVKKLTQKEKENIRNTYNSMSHESMRVLAFAYRDLSKVSSSKYLEEAEKKLTWVGMMGMIDPPRKNINKAISLCRMAGIKIIMITGDYELTAKAIAKKVGILKDENEANNVINGSQLNLISDEEIVHRVNSGELVFARISPEQKLRIASVLKKAGMVIAMTGDGVNDALALKKADIGIAMGKIGTDVAKEAGEMILLDDNLASIVKAIKEGRTIYQNIKKFTHYVFTSNVSELCTVLLGLAFQLPSPISAIQILMVDLGTDVLPSLSLGIDPEEPGIIHKKPFNPNEKIINKKGFKRLIYIGSIMAGMAVLTFYWSMTRGGWVFGHSVMDSDPLYIKSTSATYAVIAMTQMANLLESRSETLSVFKLGFFKNKYAIYSIISSVVLLLLLLHVPILRELFHLSPIDNIDWLMVAGSTLLVFIMEELRKKFIQS